MNRRLIPILFSMALLFSGCNGGAGTTTSTPPPAPTPVASPSPLTEFEEDLQFIRNGSYTYVWIFSRKDGKPLDAKDGDFLRKNAPQVVDWVTTDGGRKVIGGTNFNLEEGNLEELKKRYIAEDHSGR